MVISSFQTEKIMAKNILRCQCTDFSNVEMWFFNYYFPFVFPNILECIYILVKATQLCPTLCDPLDCTVHGVFQARILEWVTFSFSRGSSQSRDQTQVSCIAGGFFTVELLGKPHTCERVCVLFQMLFPYKLSSNIEHSSW